jgi:hypothetical protein
MVVLVLGYGNGKMNREKGKEVDRGRGEKEDEKWWYGKRGMKRNMAGLYMLRMRERGVMAERMPVRCRQGGTERLVREGVERRIQGDWG